MSFPRYPKYKDSGVEWLGEVPGHWNIVKLQDLAQNTPYSFVDGPFGSDLKNEEYTDAGVPLIQLNNINEGYHVLNDVKYISEKKADDLIKHNALPGDIVIAKMADPVARAAIVRNDFERYVVVADCIRLAVDENKVVPSFSIYSINSKYFRANAESVSSGITRLRINLGVLKKLRFALPPREEQSTIAAFLDRETAKIDELIAEQQRLIELLKEKRQAVISHAVTKGLNPNATMKDSGIEWLGEVPEHWAIKQLRHVSNIVRGASPRPAGDPIFFSYDNTIKENIPWVTVAEITKDSSVYLCDVKEYLTPLGVKNSQYFESGTLIFSNSGATLGVPKILSISCCANDGVLVFKDLSITVNILFIYYFLLTTTERLRTEMKQGGGQPNLNTDIVKNIGFAVPPIVEQSFIVAFLENETTQLDELTTEANRAIELLKERRTALISAAVTGKIDVRGLGQSLKP